MDEQSGFEREATYAPIAIFCYKRASHLENTLRTLMACGEFQKSPIFLFSDGPRSVAETREVENTRDVARSLLPQHTKFFLSKQNKGLSASLSDGISKVLRDYSSVIVIEDDLVVHPKFLNYMNFALQKFADQKAIFQVSGYMFPLKSDESFSLGNSIFLAPYITSWGWGTWSDRWDSFDLECPGWKRTLANHDDRYRFNARNSYDYWGMLKRQRCGVVDSWAIAWYYAVFCKKGSVIYPPWSMVTNNGFDGTGSNGNRFISDFGGKIELSNQDLPDFNIIEEKAHLCVKIFESALFRSGGGWIRYFINFFRNLWS